MIENNKQNQLFVSIKDLIKFLSIIGISAIFYMVLTKKDIKDSKNENVEIFLKTVDKKNNNKKYKDRNKLKIKEKIIGDKSFYQYKYNSIENNKVKENKVVYDQAISQDKITDIAIQDIKAKIFEDKIQYQLDLIYIPDMEYYKVASNQDIQILLENIKNIKHKPLKHIAFLRIARIAINNNLIQLGISILELDKEFCNQNNFSSPLNLWLTGLCYYYLKDLDKAQTIWSKAIQLIKSNKKMDILGSRKKELIKIFEDGIKSLSSIDTISSIE